MGTVGLRMRYQPERCDTRASAHSARIPERPPTRHRVSDNPGVLIEHAVHPEYLSNAYLVADGIGGTAVFVDSGAPFSRCSTSSSTST